MMEGHAQRFQSFPPTYQPHDLRDTGVPFIIAGTLKGAAAALKLRARPTAPGGAAKKWIVAASLVIGALLPYAHNTVLVGLRTISYQPGREGGFSFPIWMRKRNLPS